MKIFFFSLSFAIVNSSFCQNFLLQFEAKNLDKITTTELVFNDTISIFSVKNTNSANSKYNIFFLKRKTENTAYFSERILNQTVYVSDSLYLMKWELLTDTITILNEKCQSAKTVFRGRNYIAYYSPRFRTDEGPWKFGGLPGLILSVKSDDNFIEWKATKIIENYKSKIILPNTTTYKFIEWNEFVKIYKQTIDKYIKSARSNGTLGNESSAKIKLDAVEIFYPELQTGEGIKF